MKFVNFFKILNKKIEKYDKATSNPFKRTNIPITLIWVEDVKLNDKDDKL